MSDPGMQESTEPNTTLDGESAPGNMAPSPSPSPPETTDSLASDNMDLVKSLFLGISFTALIYEVFPLPFLEGGAIYPVLDNKVSEVIVGMTLWSLFLLAFKYAGFRRQQKVKQAFLRSALPRAFQAGVYAKNANELALQLQREMIRLRVRRFQTSVLYRRLLRLLHFIRTVAKKDGLNDFLDYQGQIDQKKLENSYAILQVFIWAIPILGFIGTVLGIGTSVSEFAEFIQTAEGGGQFSSQMRAALGGVTSGLAVAFNTTFLALVLVIPVMIITSFLQKIEEEYLLGIEEYLMEDLLPHLRVEPGQNPVSESFDEHLHRIIQLSETWVETMEPMVKQLTRQGEMMSLQISGIQPLIKNFIDRLLKRTEHSAGSQTGSASAPGLGREQEIPVVSEDDSPKV